MKFEEVNEVGKIYVLDQDIYGLYIFILDENNGRYIMSNKFICRYGEGEEETGYLKIYYTGIPILAEYAKDSVHLRDVTDLEILQLNTCLLLGDYIKSSKFQI